MKKNWGVLLLILILNLFFGIPRSFGISDVSYDCLNYLQNPINAAHLFRIKADYLESQEALSNHPKSWKNHLRLVNSANQYFKFFGFKTKIQKRRIKKTRYCLLSIKPWKIKNAELLRNPILKMISNLSSKNVLTKLDTRNISIPDVEGSASFDNASINPSWDELILDKVSLTTRHELVHYSYFRGLILDLKEFEFQVKSTSKRPPQINIKPEPRKAKNWFGTNKSLNKLYGADYYFEETTAYLYEFFAATEFLNTLKFDKEIESRIIPIVDSLETAIDFYKYSIPTLQKTMELTSQEAGFETITDSEGYKIIKYRMPDKTTIDLYEIQVKKHLSFSRAILSALLYSKAEIDRTVTRLDNFSKTYASAIEKQKQDTMISKLKVELSLLQSKLSEISEI